MNEGNRKAVKNGKSFEATTDLGFRLETDYTDVIHQNEFYDYFGIKWSDFLSKKIIPDEVLVNHKNGTIYVIEKKSQSSNGSSDEKLYCCHAKKQQYEKMLAKAGCGYKVQLIYLCSDWFRKPCYKDTFDYMDSVGVKHFFNEIPLSELGIVA